MGSLPIPLLLISVERASFVSSSEPPNTTLHTANTFFRLPSCLSSRERQRALPATSRTMTAVTAPWAESPQARSQTRRSPDHDLQSHYATVYHSLRVRCLPLPVPTRSQTWRSRYPSKTLEPYQTSSEKGGICYSWKRCSSPCITQRHLDLARGRIQQGTSIGAARHGSLDRECKQREATRTLLASRTGH